MKKVGAKCPKVSVKSVEWFVKKCCKNEYHLEKGMARLRPCSRRRDWRRVDRVRRMTVAVTMTLRRVRNAAHVMLAVAACSHILQAIRVAVLTFN